MTLLATGQANASAPRRRRFPIVFVILLTALSITMAGIFPFRQLIAQERQVDQTQARLDRLVEENTALEDHIAALSSDAGVERLAREEYGLVRPGEIAFSVDLGEEASRVAASESLDDDPLDERTLLERAWDWLTGRDLVPDE